MALWTFARLVAAVVLVLVSGAQSSGSSGAYVRVGGSWCAYDRLKVQWHLPDGADEQTVSVGLYDAGTAWDAPPLHLWAGPKALGVQWPQQLAARWRAQHAPRPPTLHCDVGGPACPVAVTTVGWDPDKRRFEVNFDRPTNAPRFEGGSHDGATTSSSSGTGFEAAIPLASALTFHPAPPRLLAAPFWEGPSKLVVLIDLPSDQRAMADAFADGSAFARVAPAPDPAPARAASPAFDAPAAPLGEEAAGLISSAATASALVAEAGEGGEWALRGRFSVRLGEVGRPLVLRLWAAGAGTAIGADAASSALADAVVGADGPAAESAPFAVSPCADEDDANADAPVVLHGLGPAALSNAPKLSGGESSDGSSSSSGSISGRFEGGGALNPTPFWDPKGVFALTGHRALVLPASSLPRGGVGAWSFSGWLWVADPPTGAYRTLLFKGPGGGGDLARTPSAWLHPVKKRRGVYIRRRGVCVREK